MTSLSDIIARLPQDDVAIATPGRAITRRELLAVAANLQSNGQMPDPVVTGGDVIDAVARMLASDGRASGMFLVPQDSRESLQPRIQELASGVTQVRPGSATQWIMATSGTTGTPKLVAHSLASLTRSHQRHGGSTFRWALLYDPCRFAGLQVSLQALIGGSTLLAAPVDDIEACVEFLLREACTSISATPSMWRKLLLAQSASKLKLKHITLGGEIADSKILERLRATFSQAKITHIYASTEAGVGFSVRDGKAGFPVSYLDSVPGDSVELKIDHQGTLLIRGKEFKQSYIGQSQPLADAEGFVNTGDLLVVDGDRVRFLGRANGSINVGGQKVMPEEVEVVLRECAAVVDVRAYGKASPILGNIVAAEVVASGEADKADVQAQLIRLCQGKLAAFKRPATIRFVDKIGLTSAGKISRSMA